MGPLPEPLDWLIQTNPEEKPEKRMHPPGGQGSRAINERIQFTLELKSFRNHQHAGSTSFEMMEKHIDVLIMPSLTSCSHHRMHSPKLPRAKCYLRLDYIMERSEAAFRRRRPYSKNAISSGVNVEPGPTKPSPATRCPCFLGFKLTKSSQSITLLTRSMCSCTKKPIPICFLNFESDVSDVLKV